MTSTRLSLTLDSKELRKILEALPKNVSEAVRKRVGRRVAKPFADNLAGKWLTAKFRGPDAKHRMAIAAATEVDVRRVGASADSVIRTRIGVRYGSGAKAAGFAKGRQKVWHLLEAGFRHYGKGSAAYRSAGPEIQAQAKARRAFVRAEADKLWQQIPGRGRRDRTARADGFRRIYAAAREAFPQWSAYANQRKQIMEGVRAGGSRFVAGRRITFRWSRANLGKLTTRLMSETLKEAKKALTKQGSKG